MRTRDDTFFYADMKYPKHKGFCRVCGKPIRDRRRVTCGDECATVLRAWPYQWSDVCAMVRKRDQGVCAHCGLDTEKLERIIWTATRQARRQALIVLGYHVSDVGKSLWQAHHENPVATHGPAQTIGEIVTLCVPCHRLAHEGRRRRHERKQMNLLAERPAEGFFA